MKNSIRLLAVIFLLTFLSCSSSNITSSWKSDKAVPRQYKKVMVLGLILDNDRSLQEKMENHLIGDLRNIGINAVSSLKEYGPKVFDKMDETSAINKLKDSGIDAVITIVLLDKQRERKYVPGNVYYSPYNYYYNRFWGYRTTLYQRIYEPGYYVTDTKYFWESNFYDMSDQKLIYSAQTETFDPVNAEILGHEYGLLIVKNMVKQKLFNQDQLKVETGN